MTDLSNATWRKAARSNSSSSGCVEIADNIDGLPGITAIRRLQASRGRRPPCHHARLRSRPRRRQNRPLQQLDTRSEQPMTDLSNARWRKAVRSNSSSSGCVEIAGNIPDLPGVTAIRDSKRSEDGAHIVTTHAFAAFLADA